MRVLGPLPSDAPMAQRVTSPETLFPADRSGLFKFCLLSRPLVYRLFACRRARTFQSFNFAAVMDVLRDLGKIAHIEPFIEPLQTGRAFFKVIGLQPPSPSEPVLPARSACTIIHPQDR
jgi:hypothetical protein